MQEDRWQAMPYLRKALARTRAQEVAMSRGDELVRMGEGRQLCVGNEGGGMSRMTYCFSN